jgi:2-polyprenyl-3-methyl-5-hydroxy-6-metoxy-1,4-benzoquinol methylase
MHTAESDPRPQRPGALAFSGQSQSASRWLAEQSGWWQAHYVQAVDEIIDFLDADGVSLHGKKVVDVGCGDGIITFGLLDRGTAKEVVGLDLQPVDVDFLQTQANKHGQYPSRLPDFRVSSGDSLPVDDSWADVVVSWSVLEHVEDVPSLLRELRRIISPQGVAFVQVWPFFDSAHGAHLWPLFSIPFVHFEHQEDELRRMVYENAPSEAIADSMWNL